MVLALGIDLGTTNCCMAVVRNGKLEIIENCDGKRTTPSIISFNKGEIIVGDSAKKDKTRSKPHCVIYDVKRLIGLKYEDERVQKIMTQLPFNLITFENKLKIMVNEDNVNKLYTPEELSGRLLQYLKKCAEKRLDCTIDNAVITVPTYFNDPQRQATIDASKIAGFKSVQLLNEPTAAAIHYGIDNNIEDGRVVLVYDFGGGTFDVSVIKYNNNLYEVLAIDGDVQLGGSDIDNEIVKYIINKFPINNDDLTPVQTIRRLARLKAIAENIKIELSTKPDSSQEFEDEDITISRTLFNQLSKNIVDKTIEIVEKCINKVNKLSIDDVVLIGGSSRIKKILDLLQEKIKKPIKQNVNPDEAVAAGAAIYAARFYNHEFPELKFTNITPYALGVEVDGGRMSNIIQKYSQLPAKITKKYETVYEDQTDIDVKVFSGDDKLTKNNTFLGEIQVTGIASGPSGTIVEETFEVDTNGILNVTVVDLSGKSRHLKLKLDKGNLTSLELIKCSTQLENDVEKSENIKEYKELINKYEEKLGKKFEKEYSENNMQFIRSQLNHL